ncbi:hypothetical protein [Sphingobium limneticum]
MQPVRMSRAINLNASQADVTALCTKHAIAISTIETLTSGGTRVVLLNPDGAERIRTLMKTKIITTPVVRSPMHMARQPSPRYR